MTDYRKRLEAVAVDLAKYDTDCTLARSYGGPTMLPRHPVDDRRARQIVADLSKLLSEGERMRGALGRAERTLRAIADSDAWASPIATIKARDADDESLRDERVNMLLDAAAKAANLARQALGDTE